MYQINLTISKEVRLFSARFRVKILPDFAVALLEKPRQKHYVAAKAAGDRQIIMPTASCSIADLPAMLKLAGWKLTGATRQDEMSGPYQILLFHFSREQGSGQINSCVFERLCTESLWQVRAFSNPFLSEDGREVSDGAITINLNSRQRLDENDGHPANIKPECAFAIKTNIQQVPLATKFAYSGRGVVVTG